MNWKNLDKITVNSLHSIKMEMLSVRSNITTEFLYKLNESGAKNTDRSRFQLECESIIESIERFETIAELIEEFLVSQANQANKED